MISSTPLVAEAGEQQRGRHVGDNGWRPTDTSSGCARHQRGRQLIEFRHTLHVADEDEEHAERGSSPQSTLRIRGDRTAERPPPRSRT